MRKSKPTLKCPWTAGKMKCELAAAQDLWDRTYLDHPWRPFCSHKKSAACWKQYHATNSTKQEGGNAN